MLKITVLIPTKYNDGSPIGPGVLKLLLSGLREITGGYTLDCIVEGRYTMDDGSIATDYSQKLWVVVDSDKLPAIREWAERVCICLKQESLYLEYQQTNVDFVRG